MSLHNHKLGIPHFPANFESYFCIHTLTISCRCFELFALRDELEVPIMLLLVRLLKIQTNGG